MRSARSATGMKSLPVQPVEDWEWVLAPNSDGQPIEICTCHGLAQPRGKVPYVVSTCIVLLHVI